MQEPYVTWHPVCAQTTCAKTVPLVKPHRRHTHAYAHRGTLATTATTMLIHASAIHAKTVAHASTV